MKNEKEDSMYWGYNGKQKTQALLVWHLGNLGGRQTLVGIWSDY